jgi:hypothetical protein
MRLRYEPGSWGDLLKALWLDRLTPALLRSLGGGSLRYGDPFAGAPAYPCTSGVSARVALLESAGIGVPASLWSGGDLRSAAGIVLGRADQRIDALLFDVDPERRRSWGARPQVRVLDIDDGWQALSSEHLGGRDLVLIDPYDLDKRWRHNLESLRGLRERGAHLLLYLYNRSPQSAPRLQDYQRFRKALAEGVGAPALVGRIPGDGRLPRAWHELLWIEGIDARCRVSDECLETLATLTERIAAAIASSGASERAAT